MSFPFLTIGIPTWNRATYLQKNLLALIDEVNQFDLQSHVEILISDNASDDSTAEMCEQMATQYSFITYHRHENNRGANANFQYVVQAAQGEYVWLLGDDDLLAEGVLTQVIHDIRHYQPDAVVGPAIYDLTKEKATHQAYTQQVLVNRDEVASEDIINLAGKISGLMFKRASVLPILAQAEAVILRTRTPWPHLAWLLLLLNNPEKKLLILPYGINQLVAANWHNLLLNGKTLVKILVLEYQALIVALKSQLAPTFYQQLLDHSIASRRAVLQKCVLYATFLDGYAQMLNLTMKAYPQLIGIQNRLNYVTFLVLPLMLPRSLRKLAYQLASKRWVKLKLTLDRIGQAKEMMQAKAAIDCRQFNEEQL